MRRFIQYILGTLSVINIHGALAQDAPTCVPACSNQVRGEFAKFACTSAEDAACLCANPDFFFGVRDCAPSCATDVQVHDFLAASFCQGQSLLFTPTGTQPVATQTTVVTTTGPPTATNPLTSAPTESPTSLPTTETSSEPTVLSTTISPAASETTSPATPATPTTSDTSALISSSTAPVSPASTTSGSAASETSAVSVPPASSGLSQAAVIGIGVGIGAAVIAIAFITIFIILRNRKRAPRQSIDISKSSPGPSRAYPNPDQGPFEKYASDIEMVSNRYEDMVPRAQPRTLV